MSAVAARPTRREAIGVLALVCLAVVGALATWFSAAAILPDLAREWQLAPAILPWMTNAVQIGFVIGALGASLFNIPDRVPLNRLMAGSALLAAACNGLLLLEPGGAVALGLRLVTGIALAGVYPSAIKLMATWFERGRGMVLGLLIGALTLGSSLPHLMRAIAGQFDWRMVVIATSLSSLGAAIIFLLVAREGPSPFARSAKLDLGAIRGILRDRPVFLANLGYFGHMWELYAMWGWFLAFAAAAQQSGLPIGNGASLLTFCVVAAGVLGCVAGGFLSDRLGRTLTCAIMMALSATCALAIGFAFDGPLWLFVAIALVWGFSIVGDSAQFSAAVTELSDRSYVGTALALQMGLGFGITVIAIWLTPILAAWVSWRWVFLFLAPGPLVGIVAMLVLRRMPAASRLANGRR